MKIKDAIREALKAIASNKLRSALTTLGVLIGVASLIALVALGEGARNYVAGQVEALGSNLIIITPGKGIRATANTALGDGATSTLTYDDAKALEQHVRWIKRVAPIVEYGAKVSFKKKSLDTIIDGTTQAYPDVRKQLLAEGRFLNADDVDHKLRVAVLGYAIRKQLFGDSDPTGKEIMLNNLPFNIIGYMHHKGTTLTVNNDDRVFIPLTAAQDLFGTNKVGMIFVQAKRSDQVKAAVHESSNILNSRHGKSDFAINEQSDILTAFRGIMQTLTGMLGGIAGVSLVVGGIGIMNIMLVSVTERTREIGIRKSLGASKRDILWQFLMESMLMSLFGGLAGAAFGTASAYILSLMIPYVATVVAWWSVILAFAFSLLVGIFFGLYPARKAAGLDPIDALRYE